jgi:hypothetical protein
VVAAGFGRIRPLSTARPARDRQASASLPGVRRAPWWGSEAPAAACRWRPGNTIACRWHRRDSWQPIGFRSRWPQVGQPGFSHRAGHGGGQRCHSQGQGRWCPPGLATAVGS